MGAIILGLFLLLFGNIIQNPLIFLLFVAAFVVIRIWFKRATNAQIERAVKVRFVKEKPIVKEVYEKSGFSRGYSQNGGYGYHDHYSKNEIITDYKATFELTFENGKKERIVCKKSSPQYDELIKKAVKSRSFSF